jgi:hypothetical protein
MITLRRRGETVKLKPALWTTLQQLARQEGWRPTGAFDVGSLSRQRDYGPGHAVAARDARGLATALERLVNSEKLDRVEIDLAPLVALVNFLRGGAFEIQ